jgi:holo-[acyl-carrier protein] synthase
MAKDLPTKFYALKKESFFFSEPNPVKFLANRFAGKEAAVKALGTGFSQGIIWKDIGVVKHKTGKPKLIFSEKIQLLLQQKNITNSHISLTDEGHWAQAFVVLEKD